MWGVKAKCYKVSPNAPGGSPSARVGKALGQLQVFVTMLQDGKAKASQYPTAMLPLLSAAQSLERSAMPN